MLETNSTVPPTFTKEEMLDLAIATCRTKEVVFEETEKRLRTEIAALKKQIKELRYGPEPAEGDYKPRWYASDNPEMYCIGPHETREAAIQEFKDENDGEAPRYIGRGKPVMCSIDGERIIENIPDDMADNSFDGMFDNWCVKIPDEKYADLSDRLTKVLHSWLDELGEAKSWDLVEEVRADS